MDTVETGTSAPALKAPTKTSDDENFPVGPVIGALRKEVVYGVEEVEGDTGLAEEFYVVLAGFTRANFVEDHVNGNSLPGLGGEGVAEFPGHGGVDEGEGFEGDGVLRVLHGFQHGWEEGVAIGNGAD